MPRRYLEYCGLCGGTQRSPATPCQHCGFWVCDACVENRTCNESPTDRHEALAPRLFGEEQDDGTPESDEVDDEYPDEEWDDDRDEEVGD